MAAAALFALGCGAQRRPPPARPHDAVHGAVHDSIKLVRTRCYADCPAYDIVIDANGTVTWHGKYYVDVHGTRIAHVDPARVRKLFAYIQREGYFQLKSQYYCSDVFDSFWVNTTVTVGGRSKTIKHYWLDEAFMRRSHQPTACVGPRKLKEIEARIDQLAGAERWIGSGGQPADGGMPEP